MESLQILISLLICSTIVQCQRDMQYDSILTMYNPETDDYKPRNVINLATTSGPIYGFTVPTSQNGISVNCYLGVPYAVPPVGYRRFRPPQRVRWSLPWKAYKYPPVCPQDMKKIKKKVNGTVQMSEDCLYLNIFQPNISIPEYPYFPVHERYPIMFYFHGGEFNWGAGQLFPGHLLVSRKVIVVTVNYRLGPLGFLSMQDQNALGNFGLLDQMTAMEFIQDMTRELRADPDKITIMGDEAGAASVGLHMISPLSRGRDLFHTAIMMDGSDLCEFAYMDKELRPRFNGEELARKLHCFHNDSYYLLDCLRRRSVDNIITMGLEVKVPPGRVGYAFTPTWDGAYGFLPDTPAKARSLGRFDHIPLIAGITKYAGAERAAAVSGNPPGNQLTKANFILSINQLIAEWRVKNVDEVAGLLEFKYTFWPKPDNDTARKENFTDLLTDKYYGTCVDEVIKAQRRYTTDVYQFVFDYVSPNSTNPQWMGAFAGQQLQYLYGAPHFDDPMWELAMLPKPQSYGRIDKNISDFLTSMWTNFTKYRTPTPDPVNETFWYTFNFDNLTYVNIGINITNHTMYRQQYYGFWRAYYPEFAERYYDWLTPYPTMKQEEYYISIWVMGAVVIFLIFLLTILACCYRRQDKQLKKERYLYSDDEPYRLGPDEYQMDKHTETSRSRGSMNGFLESEA
ncbi:cholinesterase 1-like [Lineus longissimus]|uniref:cholinesterase 1-like n=1 Tax=Lineus longissimus TaxID=88925 RepID=UPI002B4D9009